MTSFIFLPATKMTRETLIENIENLKRWFEKKYTEVIDTDLEVRMGTHIAEARLTLKLQNHIDDDGIERACDILYRAYEDIREIWLKYESICL